MVDVPKCVDCVFHRLVLVLPVKIEKPFGCKIHVSRSKLHCFIAGKDRLHAFACFKAKAPNDYADQSARRQRLFRKIAWAPLRSEILLAVTRRKGRRISKHV